MIIWNTRYYIILGYILRTVLHGQSKLFFDGELSLETHMIS